MDDAGIGDIDDDRHAELVVGFETELVAYDLLSDQSQSVTVTSDQPEDGSSSPSESPNTSTLTSEEAMSPPKTSSTPLHHLRPHSERSWTLLGSDLSSVFCGQYGEQDSPRELGPVCCRWECGCSQCCAWIACQGVTLVRVHPRIALSRYHGRNDRWSTRSNLMSERDWQSASTSRGCCSWWTGDAIVGI